MRIEIRSDSVLLDGYVNAVGRDSRPIITAVGKCVEQIEPRAFQRALERAPNAYRVVIKLYATNKPFRYPRVSELDFGVIIGDSASVDDICMAAKYIANITL